MKNDDAGIWRSHEHSSMGNFDIMAAFMCPGLERVVAGLRKRQAYQVNEAHRQEFTISTL